MLHERKRAEIAYEHTETGEPRVGIYRRWTPFSYRPKGRKWERFYTNITPASQRRLLAVLIAVGAEFESWEGGAGFCQIESKVMRDVQRSLEKYNQKAES